MSTTPTGAPTLTKDPGVVMRRFLIPFVAVLPLLACGSGEDVVVPVGEHTAGMEVESMAAMRLPGTPSQRPDSLLQDMVIRTGKARVEVDSLEAAVASLEALAERVDGYTTDVAIRTVRTGRQQRREATVTLRVPVGAVVVPLWWGVRAVRRRGRRAA